MPEGELEQKFRDRYGEDPAGAVFEEVISLHQRMNAFEQELSRLRDIIKDIDPERMESMERTELLREINKKMDEMTPKKENK